MNQKLDSTRAALLARRGLLFLEDAGDQPNQNLADAAALELAELGYVLSTRLHQRMAQAPIRELTDLRKWTWSVLSSQVGADQRHTPLFRRFPEGIPDDTFELWLKRVAVHFLQAEDQNCLFCRRTGTTHLLRPCQHVVCDHCFDGSNYSACPVCGHQVDSPSPFFQFSEFEIRELPRETVRFKMLDLGGELDSEARALFVSLCERRQALSPDDKDVLELLLDDYRDQVLQWLPESIPVRENIAAIFGTLTRTCNPDDVLPVAQLHMTTATDVLRFVASYSGADPSLQPETGYRTAERMEPPGRFWTWIAGVLHASPPQPRLVTYHVPQKKNRFPVAKLPRPLRRMLLGVLENLEPELLAEDMLRHRSLWVWIGEFLHPHEYRKRFPNVAGAFAIVRKKTPDGTPAPAFQSFSGRVEAAANSGDARRMAEILLERPGELARRFDHALRVAGNDSDASARVVSAFTDSVPRFSTPVLLTLWSYLPTRLRKSDDRVFWPKGQVSTGVSAPETRPLLPRRAVEPAVRAVEDELLRRFAEKPAFDSCIIDSALKDIIVPFNERTASRSAISLPRGSAIPVPPGKIARLFMHWCEPKTGGSTTDLDLSVALYDEKWEYKGVCSYYELKYGSNNNPIAVSSGDILSAPYPDGSSEFIDLDRQRAIENGIRYAVMVVTSYGGMPFGLLDRAYAGLMLREDRGGSHFDPRTVELKFAMTGPNGIYMPLVFDLQQGTLHWLDAYSKGQFQYNNVKSSNSSIRHINPLLLEYFASGARTSMYRLAVLHAAARGQKVIIRGQDTAMYVRRSGESAHDFFTRITSGTPDETGVEASATVSGTTFAALYRGDIDLPEGTTCYALFRERVTPTITASDLISA